jgi:hypothetical protein
MMDLCDRQRRLPEIGVSGQDRIRGARIDVRGNDGAILQAEYLCRAGVEIVTIMPRAEPTPFAHEAAFRFAASRRVGAGAWRALAEIKAALGMSG